MKSRIKKIIALSMLVLLFAGTYANGYMESKHFDLFTEAKESKQIKEDENKLVKFIKGNNLELDNKEQIDYKNAIKIYTDINIDKDYNLKNLYEDLNHSAFIWSIPITDKFYRAEYAESKPLNESIKHLLTKEEILEINSNQGRYKLFRLKTYDKELVNYKNIVDNLINKNDLNRDDVKVKFIGNLNNNRYLKAVVFVNKQPKFIVPFELNISTRSTTRDSDGYIITDFNKYLADNSK